MLTSKPSDSEALPCLQASRDVRIGVGSLVSGCTAWRVLQVLPRRGVDVCLTWFQAISIPRALALSAFKAVLWMLQDLSPTSASRRR